jgi:hypothetical protein
MRPIDRRELLKPAGFLLVGSQLRGQQIAAPRDGCADVPAPRMFIHEAVRVDQA